jgi:outer membrane biosynthesis protein TonB
MPSKNSTRETNRRLIASAILCGSMVLVAGCHRHTVMAAPPVSTAPAKTEPQPPAPAPVETKPEPVPETPPATAPAPTTPAPAPPTIRPAPRKTDPQPLPVPERPPAPLISPQLSPDDQAAFERKTNEKIAGAKKNLQRAYGRELNAAQHDLVEKINTFLGQSREALRAADWTRAYNLAQKAYLLSIDLASSF